MSYLENLRWKLIGFLGRIILWFWGKSCRTTIIGQEHYDRLREIRAPVVLMIWHGRIFWAPYFFRNKGVVPLISPSRDGEIPARIMSGWGYKILRGSSSHLIKGALAGMLRALKEGQVLGIITDGPKGPDRTVKTGGIKLAQRTGAYILPFTFSGAKTKRFNSWDRFMIVRPFSRVVAMFDQPVQIEADLTEIELEEARLAVEKKLLELDDRADRYFGELS